MNKISQELKETLGKLKTQRNIFAKVSLFLTWLSEMWRRMLHYALSRFCQENSSLPPNEHSGHFLVILRISTDLQLYKLKI